MSEHLDIGHHCSLHNDYLGNYENALVIVNSLFGKQKECFLVVKVIIIAE